MSAAGAGRSELVVSTSATNEAVATSPARPATRPPTVRSVMEPRAADARRRPTRLDTCPLMPRTLRIRRAPLSLAAALLLALAAPAVAVAADPVTIASDPLTIHIGERGQLQATRAGDAGGMFFPPALPT